MNNEFEKLDVFMKTHKPSLESIKAPSAPKVRSRWWMPLTVGVAAATLVITINIRQNQAQLDRDTIASVEALDWEMTEDELTTDVTDLVALAD